MNYIDQLGYEPRKGDIYVVFETYRSRNITRRFSSEEALRAYPKNIRKPDWSDAAGNFHPGSGIEFLIKWDGKRFRRIR